MKKFMKKFLTGVVGLALCVCIFTFVGCGKKPKDYGENAIVISNYEELKTFLNDFAEGDYDDSEISDEGKYLVISKDIDCNGEVLTPLLSQDLQGLKFRIDGDGHKISNFKLDETCIRGVGSAAGSSVAYFNVLSLFPVSNGGIIENLEFKDVTIKLDNYDVGAQANAIQIGIVGYTRSNGDTFDFDQPNCNSSIYRNIKVTNLNVDVSTSTPAVANKYCFAVGGFIGLDADTIQSGDYLSAQTPKAVRENITVSNLDVNVDVKGGTFFFGGISGMSNYETVSYKNCQVSGNVKITNYGEDVVPSYIRGQLGNIVSAGGICGGTIKGQYGIDVQNCKTDIDYEIDSKNPEDLVNVGKFLGMAFVSPSDAYAEFDKANSTDTSTVKLNTLGADDVVEVEGTAVAVEQDLIKYNAQGEKVS